ncbi:MAG: hypothetical protein FWD74_11240, partial [Actinomycetia bacterium]|nr:hypothetical protein [Actinomycetes bacterium]
NLTSITSPGGLVTSIGYDADNRPTRVTDPTGAVTGVVYDAVGRVTWVTDPNGHQTHYSYDAAGNTVAVTDPNGNTTGYAYDAAGNMTGSTSPRGEATAFVYDALNRVVSATDPTGAVTGYGYDAASQLTSVTDPTGRATSYDYAPDGLLAAVTAPGGAVTRYAHDAAGNVTGVTDPRGGTVSLAYTPTGLVASQTDQNGNTTAYAYDAAGLLASATDPAGVTTAYRHDPNGLLTAVIDNAGGAGGAASADVTTSYGYDADGRLTSITAPGGGVTRYVLDGAGRVTKVTDPLGQVSRYGYDPAGNLTASTDGNGNTIAYTYDPADQIIGRTSGTDALVPSAYSYDGDGRLTGTTDAIGNASYAYDAAGRLVTAVNDHGLRLAYGYDGAGRLASLTYPDGRTATYGYDRAGLVSSLTDASGTVSYGYDSAGELTAVARPNGTATAYTYDPAGNVTRIDHTTTASGGGGVGPASGGASPLAGLPDTTVTAPAAQSVSAPVAVAGGPAVELDSVVATALAAASSATPVLPGPLVPPGATGPNIPSAGGGSAGGGLVCVPGPDGRPVSAGCPLTSADPLPLRLDYTYDSDNRVTSQTQTSANLSLTADYSYDGLGRLVSATRTDGIDSTWSYDADGNPVSSTSTDPVTLATIDTASVFSATGQLLRESSSDGSGVVDSYDTAGDRITQTTTDTAGKTNRTAYSYDAQQRLVTASSPGSGSTRISYDALGQIASITLPNPPNPVTGRPDCPNGSVQVGCPAAAGSANAAGRQGSARTVFGGDPAWAAYSGDQLVYIADTLVIDRVDIVYGPDGADHQTQATKAGAVTLWYHPDRLGAVRALTDQAGATVAATAYGPTGAADPACAVPGVSSVPAASPLGYTSEIADPANGLQHYQARSYQPGSSQWLQPDPSPGQLDRPTSLAKYAYVENNPATYIDNNGKALMSPGGGNCQYGVIAYGSWKGYCAAAGTMYPKPEITLAPNNPCLSSSDPDACIPYGPNTGAGDYSGSGRSTMHSAPQDPCPSNGHYVTGVCTINAKDILIMVPNPKYFATDSNGQSWCHKGAGVVKCAAAVSMSLYDLTGNWTMMLVCTKNPGACPPITQVPAGALITGIPTSCERSVWCRLKNTVTSAFDPRNQPGYYSLPSWAQKAEDSIYERGFLIMEAGCAPVVTAGPAACFAGAAGGLVSSLVVELLYDLFGG